MHPIGPGKTLEAAPPDLQPQSEFQDQPRTGIHGLGSLKAPTTAWNEDDQPTKKSGKPLYLKWLRYAALGAISFLFFLYTTFPYGVLKEVVVDRVNQEIQASGMPIRVSIQSLEPYWFTGLEMKNFAVRNVSSPTASLNLETARIYVNPFSLFIGRIGIRLYLTQSSGWTSFRMAIPILTLLSGAPSPSSATLDLRGFSLDPFLNHALALAAGSKDPAMLLVAPLLSKTSIGGKLSGTIDFSNPSPEHFGNATGNFEISVSDGFLHIADETLKIRKQSFTTANLDLKFESSALVLGKETKFVAEDIEISLDGRISLPDLNKQPTQVDLNLGLTMRDKILDSLGFIVPNMLRCPPMVEGVLKVNLSGPLSGMSCGGI